MIRIDAIDLHTHLTHGMPGEPENTPLYRADLPYLLEQYQRLHIACGVFSTFASVLHGPEGVYEENEYLRAVVKDSTAKDAAAQNAAHDAEQPADGRKEAGRKPAVYQWTVIDPRDPRTYGQAEEILEDPTCLGIKLHPAYHGYDICDYAEELFAFAEAHHTFVLTHPDPPEMILRIVPFADRHPGMKLIIAHMGSLEHIEAVRRAANGNIYTDTSGIASSRNNIIEYAVSVIGSEKIFFGTDTYSAAFQRGRIELAGISRADKINILRENALREFPKLK